jgi:ACS family hexuronate transporter-like MFS transporter
MFLTMFGLAGFVVLSVAYATRAFPPGHSGLLAGIGAGSWGAIVALMMPWFGRLFDQSAYVTAFRVATLFPIAGYLIWLALSAALRPPQRRGLHDEVKQILI